MKGTIFVAWIKQIASATAMHRHAQVHKLKASIFRSGSTDQRTGDKLLINSNVKAAAASSSNDHST